MIRATNNGVTALIDPFGKITAQIPQFQQAVLYGDVVPMQQLTPYLQWRSGRWRFSVRYCWDGRSWRAGSPRPCDLPGPHCGRGGQ